MEDCIMYRLWPFEYVMTPFDPTNTPIVFQHLMNDVFHEYLNDFVV
jgi:hypothetical protein